MTPCRHCHRSDCPLLAGSIYGLRDLLHAVRDCYVTARLAKKAK